MGEDSPPPPKRGRLATGDLSDLTKEELIKKYEKQQDYVEELEGKITCNPGDDNDDKDKNTVSESSRRENILVMRLANKEQEVQEYAAQISHIKKAQEDAAILSLRQANLDPGVNLLFGKMREELQQTKDKLEQAQSELSAWKFTPDSQNGKKLISRCRTLIAENQELGRQLSQGKSAQLEAELALQKKYSEELKASQDELNEFVIQLDEEVEGMQSTIQVLQQQLATAKRASEDYKKIISKYESGQYVKKEIDTGPEHFKIVTEYNGSTQQSVSRNRTANKNAYDGQHINEETTQKLSKFHKETYDRVDDNEFTGNGDMEESAEDQHHDYCEVLESVDCSPGTPTTESLHTGRGNAEQSPGTPVQDHMDYIDDETDSWSKDQAGDEWDERTSTHYTDSSDEDEAFEVEVEQQDISSLTSDNQNEETDDIKAHITAVTPPLDQDNACQSEVTDRFPEDITNNVKGHFDNVENPSSLTHEKNAENQHKSTLHSSSRDNNNCKPSMAANEKVYNPANSHLPTEVLRTREEDAQAVQDSTITSMPKPAVGSDQAALIAYYKNFFAQPIVMPDGNTILPGPIAALGAGAVIPRLPIIQPTVPNDNKGGGMEQQPYQLQPHEIMAQQNALLAAATMMQGAYSMRQPSSEAPIAITKPCAAPMLNNHAVGLVPQNGVEDIEKSE